MERDLASVKIGCPARTSFIRQHGRFLRWRCTDRNCPDVRDAKPKGLQVFHVYDWDTGKQWTDVKPRNGQEAR